MDLTRDKHNSEVVPPEDELMDMEGDEQLDAELEAARAAEAANEELPEDKKLLDLMERQLIERGGSPRTAVRYRTYGKRFLQFMHEKGWKLETLPITAVTMFAAATSPNPVTQNVMGQAVRSLLNTAKFTGTQVPIVDIPHHKITRRRKPGVTPPAGTPSPLGQYPPQPVPFPTPQQAATAGAGTNGNGKGGVSGNGYSPPFSLPDIPFPNIQPANPRMYGMPPPPNPPLVGLKPPNPMPDPTPPATISGLPQVSYVNTPYGPRMVSVVPAPPGAAEALTGGSTNPQNVLPPTPSSMGGASYAGAAPAQQQGRGRGGTVLPSGGKVRIGKRATGYEDIGIAPGTIIPIGTYTISDLSVDGSVRTFIERNIHPFATAANRGQAYITYVVEQLDARGNVTRNDDYTFMVLDAAAGAGAAQAPVPSAPLQPVVQARAQHISALEERLIQTALEREEKARQEHDALLKTLSEKQQTDPTLLLLLSQALKPKDEGLKEMLDELRREKKAAEDATLLGSSNRVSPFGYDSPAGAGSLGGLSGLGAGAGLGHPRDPLAEAAAEALRGQNPLDMVLKLAEVMKPREPPPSALESHLKILMEQNQALAKQNQDIILAMAKSEKSRGISESLGDLTAILTVVEKLQNRQTQDAGPSMGEVMITALENPGSIAALGDVVKSLIPGMGPPQLPARQAQAAAQGQAQQQARIAAQQAAQQAQNAVNPVAAQAQARAQQRVAAQQQQAAAQAHATAVAAATAQALANLPEAAREALKLMAKATDSQEGDQQIADNLFSFLLALREAPQPWPEFVSRVYLAFIRAESKPELRSLVQSIYKYCGASGVIDSKGIENITRVVHQNYSLIYKQLTNREKTLVDADAPATLAAPSASDAVPVENAVPSAYSERGKPTASDRAAPAPAGAAPNLEAGAGEGAEEGADTDDDEDEDEEDEDEDEAAVVNAQP